MAQLENKAQDGINRQRLSVKEFKKIIKEKNGVLIVSFSKIYFNDTYSLSDGQVLVNFETHAYLYNSLDDLKIWIGILDKKAQESTPTHILKNRLLYNKDFLSHIPELVAYTATFFKLKKATPSIEQLKIIDSVINDSHNNFSFDEKIFSGLVAYVGEIVREKSSGSKWQLIPNNHDKDVWEPYVIGETKRYNPFQCVYKEVYEEFPETKSINLTESLLIEIDSLMK